MVMGMQRFPSAQRQRNVCCDGLWRRLDRAADRAYRLMPALVLVEYCKLMALCDGSEEGVLTMITHSPDAAIRCSGA